MIEQEVKLPFDSVEAARQAVLTAGGRPVLSRRPLQDCLYDADDTWLRRSGRALRIRREPERAFMTMKGPVQPGPVKAREELETTIGDAAIVELIFDRLGFRPMFRSEKYREEYALGASHIAID